MLPDQDMIVLTNLPLQITPLIGRRAEIQALDSLLNDRETRIITVIGSGGMGKTVFALEAARNQLQRFRDGVYLITLSEMGNPQQLTPLIADTLRWQNTSSQDLTTQLIEFLRERNLLLVIDNAEYLRDSEAFLITILSHARGVKILAISRVKLNLYAETLFPLGGLAYSEVTGDTTRSNEAVELFIQRSKNVRPNFQLTAEAQLAIEEICRLTQGMPLALVLAASWMTLLSPQEIAKELGQGFQFLESDFGDLPERQRSLRTIFDFTWGLMEEPEKRVFARLCVFRQGFTLEAAQRVGQGTLHSLRNLLKTAVLQPLARDGRFEIHELLRQYAVERLQQSNELDNMLAVHSQYFLEWVRDHTGHLKDYRQLETLNEFQADEANIRAAWEQAVQDDEQALLSEALEGLFWYCIMRSRYPLFESLYTLTKSEIKYPANASVRLLLARLQLFYHWMQRWREGSFIHYPTVVEELESLQVLFGHAGAPYETALCTLILSDALRTLTDDLERAIQLQQTALAAFHLLGDDFYTAWALHFNAKLKSDTQGIVEGVELLNQGLALRRKHGDQIGAAYSLYNLSINLLLLSELEECAQITQEILKISRVTGEQSTLLLAQITQTLLDFLEGQFEVASHQNALNQKLAENLNHSLGLAWVNIVQSLLDGLAGRSQVAGEALALSENLTSQASVRYFVHLSYALIRPDHPELFERHLFSALSQAEEFAAFGARVWCLPPLAMLHAGRGEFVQAAELLALAETQPRNLMGWLPTWLQQTRLEAQLENQLSGDVFAAAEQRGRNLDITQVIRSLLSPRHAQKLGSSSIPKPIQAANHRLIEPLSDRELEVIAYIGRGLSNREIASELVVELSTVKKHLTHIYDKLNVETRAQAILRAQQLQLVW